MVSRGCTRGAGRSECLRVSEGCYGSDRQHHCVSLGAKGSLRGLLAPGAGGHTGSVQLCAVSRSLPPLRARKGVHAQRPGGSLQPERDQEVRYSSYRALTRGSLASPGTL